MAGRVIEAKRHPGNNELGWHPSAARDRRRGLGNFSGNRFTGTGGANSWESRPPIGRWTPGGAGGWSPDSPSVRGGGGGRLPPQSPPPGTTADTYCEQKTVLSHMPHHRSVIKGPGVTSPSGVRGPHTSRGVGDPGEAVVKHPTPVRTPGPLYA